MKINSLQIENVKRIKAVKIEPAKDGLTVIGGKNAQGKTSVLDAITWALGGEKYRPSMAQRNGSTLPPSLRIVMDNGLVVERKGKNSSLTVTDPTGKKAGQQLLNEFVEELALNLPKFMNASGKEKANTLLQIIGVGDQLAELDRQEKELYQERLYVGRTADQKAKFAKEQPYFPDAPEDLVSPSDLIRQQQDILARNGQRRQWMREHDSILERISSTEELIKEYKRKLGELQEALAQLEEKRKNCEKSPKELEMESTEELEASIANVEEINRKVRANLDKAKAEDDAKAYQQHYDSLSIKLEEVRKQRTALLNGAQLPLHGLSVEEGELTYLGQKWDNMSSSQQLMVATAIVRKLNPKCGFVLLDKLEQMDLESLQTFGEWLKAEGLQAIATRVSTGDECSIIIEDGYITQPETPEQKPEPVVPSKWQL